MSESFEPKIELAQNSPSRGRTWRQFRSQPGAVIGLGILVFLLLLAVLGPLVSSDPIEQHLRDRLEPPSSQFWFGTDELGRDIFARIAGGAPISLASGMASVVVGLAIGVPIGLTAGYVGGGLGLVLMAFIDLLLAIPAILLAITVAARFGSGLTSAMFAVGLLGVPVYARLARAATLELRRRELVDAARAAGASDFRIVTRHVLPNISGPLAVQSTIGVGNAILFVSALGFLGLGAQPPDPEWGRMLADAQRVITDAPWAALFPGIAISLTVLGCNLAGDGLRNALDPVTSG